MVSPTYDSIARRRSVPTGHHRPAQKAGIAVKWRHARRMVAGSGLSVASAVIGNGHVQSAASAATVPGMKIAAYLSQHNGLRMTMEIAGGPGFYLAGIVARRPVVQSVASMTGHPGVTLPIALLAKPDAFQWVKATGGPGVELASILAGSPGLQVMASVIASPAMQITAAAAASPTVQFVTEVGGYHGVYWTSKVATNPDIGYVSQAGLRPCRQIIGTFANNRHVQQTASMIADRSLSALSDIADNELVSDMAIAAAQTGSRLYDGLMQDSRMQSGLRQIGKFDRVFAKTMSDLWGL